MLRILVPLLISLSVLGEPLAEARPIFAKGVWALMSWNRPDLNEVIGTYSLTPAVSFGGRYLRLPVSGEATRELYLPQASLLFWRYNDVDFQSNLYGSAGLGLDHLSAPGSGASYSKAVFGDLEADFETRSIYASAEYQAVRLSSLNPLGVIRGRAGFAPYTTEIEGFHSWLLLQVESHPGSKDAASVTPMLRFYYQNVLFEVGSSLRGEWSFNWMVHSL